MRPSSLCLLLAKLKNVWLAIYSYPALSILHSSLCIQRFCQVHAIPGPNTVWPGLVASLQARLMPLFVHLG